MQTHKFAQRAAVGYQYLRQMYDETGGNMTTVARMTDGRIVEVVRVAERVAKKKEGDGPSVQFHSDQS